MHKLKTTLLSLLGITSIFVAILAYILISYDNQDYKQLLIKVVDASTDYTLSINGSFRLDRSLIPQLSASNVELHSKANKNYIRVGDFRIQITLAPLFRKTLLINDLLVDNMRIEIHPSEEPQGSTNLLNFLPTPIIEHAQLNNIQLISDADRQVHRLDSLVISAIDRLSPVEVHSTGSVKGHNFDIKGQLGPLTDIFTLKKPYPINLVATWKQAEFIINGTILDPPHGEGLDLVGKINAPEIAEIVESIPIKGDVQAMAHLKGAFTHPVLAEIHASIVDQQSIKLQVTGSTKGIKTHKKTNLHLTGFIHDAKLLKWMMPEDSPSFNSLTIETGISESSQDFILQNVALNLSNDQGLNISFTGYSHIVLQQQPLRSLEVEAVINSPDTTTVKPYLGNFLPEMGPVHGSVGITTQGKDFFLSHIDVLAGVDKKVQLTAKGRVGPLSVDLQADESEIALNLSLKAEHSSDLTSLLDIIHPEIGPITIAANLNGSFDYLKLNHINLEAGNPDVLSILAEGWIAWDKLGSDSPEESTNITIQANTPEIQNAARLYREVSPKLGAAKFSMRIQGKGDVLEGTDLDLKIGTENSLLLSIQGKVKQIVYADLFYKGIELTGNLSGKSTRHLSELLENNKVPDMGPFSGKFVIRGDSNNIQIPQLSLSAGQENLLLFSASGKIADIPLRQAAPLQGVAIALTVTAPNSANLSSVIGSEIPDLGPLYMTGQLLDGNGVFAIDDLFLLAGDPKQPTVRMSGSVKDVFSSHSLHMKILFDEKTLVKLFDLRPIPGGGQLKGSALVSNASGSLSVKDLTIESGKSELINLKIIGSIENVTKAGQLSANAVITIKQPELFGKLLAIDLSGLNPISASGFISGNKNGVNYKGHGFIGKSKLTSDLALSFIDKKPKITGEINSPNIFLEDFGVLFKAAATSQIDSPKQVKTILFSDTPLPINVLHKVDLDLKLRFFKMTGIDYQLDRVNIDLLLQNGNLSVSPLVFEFSEGRVSMNAGINALQTPKWQFSIEGDSIELGKVFKKQPKPPPIEGDLNFIIDLKSAGNSAHQFVANLEGGFGFTLENGGVTRSQLEVVFLNPLGWLFSHGISGNEFHISCGLGRYKVKKGIIRSKIFLIDGPKLLVRGNTELNLGNETINSLFNLEKKNFLDNTIIPVLVPTSVPIKISGNMSDPSIEEVSVPSVISKADRYIFAPVVGIPQELLGTVFDLFEDSKEAQSPCTAYLQN